MGSKTSKQELEIRDDILNFEDLSNDLIYEVFDYLSFHDILYSFGKLNNRLEYLIDTYAHYVNLQKFQEKNLQSLPKHILILKISARYQFSLIDFSQIRSLRGLMISNLKTELILQILNNIVLDNLEYVYLGACSIDDYTWETELTEIQEKILSLGVFKLQKCVFRMKFFANIDRLPVTLPALEYFRVDGCENIVVINQLLNRMPNLISLNVSAFQSVETLQISQDNTDKHQCLRRLNIRIQSWKQFKDLNFLFVHHGAKIKNLIICLQSNEDRDKNHSKEDIRSKVIRMINEHLPYLISIDIRLRFSNNYVCLNPSHSSPRYVEKIPRTDEHQAYRLSIASELLT